MQYFSPRREEDVLQYEGIWLGKFENRRLEIREGSIGRRRLPRLKRKLWQVLINTNIKSYLKLSIVQFIAANGYSTTCNDLTTSIYVISKMYRFTTP